MANSGYVNKRKNYEKINKTKKKKKLQKLNLITPTFCLKPILLSTK